MTPKDWTPTLTPAKTKQKKYECIAQPMIDRLPDGPIFNNFSAHATEGARVNRCAASERSLGQTCLWETWQIGSSVFAVGVLREVATSRKKNAPGASWIEYLGMQAQPARRISGERVRNGLTDECEGCGRRVILEAGVRVRFF